MKQGSKRIFGRKQKNIEKILNVLLSEPKNVSKIKEETELSHQTMAVDLAELQKRGFIKQIKGSNRRERVYRLTSRGLLYLKKPDDMVKSQAFMLLLSVSGMGGISILPLFDHRLPEQTLKNHEKVIKDKLLPGLKEENQSVVDEFVVFIKKFYEECDIIPPYQPNEASLQNLKMNIGEVVLFIISKCLKDNRTDYLNILYTFPKFYLHIMRECGIDADYVLSNLAVTPNFEQMLIKCQKLTVKEYKQLVEYVKEIIK